MRHKLEVLRRRPVHTLMAVLIIVVLSAAGVAQLSGARQNAGFEAQRGSRTRWGRLKFRSGRIVDWGHHPEGDLNLIQRIRNATNVNLEFDFGTPDVSRLEQMVEYPFIFMHGQELPAIKELERENIREYLRRGGFLFIDDCVKSSRQPDLFYQAMRREMRRILPGARYENFAADKNHEIFNCAYRMDNGFPHAQGRNHGLIGVYDKDRLVAVMCASDLHCAWAQLLGRQREEQAMQMAVNIYVYAMTH